MLEPNWTPKEASRADDLPDTPLVVITPEGGSVEIVKWEPQYREIAVKVETPTIVRIKTYNFPGWTARIDGQAAPISSDGDGAQTIKVSSGIHRIQVSFVNTAARSAGLALSGIALVVLTGLIVFDYYAKGRRGGHESRDNVI